MKYQYRPLNVNYMSMYTICEVMKNRFKMSASLDPHQKTINYKRKLTSYEKGFLEGLRYAHINDSLFGCDEDGNELDENYNILNESCHTDIDPISLLESQGE